MLFEAAFSLRPSKIEDELKSLRNNKILMGSSANWRWRSFALPECCPTCYFPLE